MDLTEEVKEVTCTTPQTSVPTSPIEPNRQVKQSNFDPHLLEKQQFHNHKIGVLTLDSTESFSKPDLEYDSTSDIPTKYGFVHVPTPGRHSLKDKKKLVHAESAPLPVVKKTTSEIEIISEPGGPIDWQTEDEMDDEAGRKHWEHHGISTHDSFNELLPSTIKQYFSASTPDRFGSTSSCHLGNESPTKNLVYLQDFARHSKTEVPRDDHRASFKDKPLTTHALFGMSSVAPIFSCTDLLPESQQFRESIDSLRAIMPTVPIPPAEPLWRESVESLKSIKPMKVPNKEKMESNKVTSKNTFLHIQSSAESFDVDVNGKKNYNRASTDPISLPQAFVYETPLKTVAEELSGGYTSLATMNTIGTTGTPAPALQPLENPYGYNNSYHSDAHTLHPIEGEEWAYISNEPTDWGEDGYPVVEQPKKIEQKNNNKKNNKGKNSKDQNGKGQNNVGQNGKGKGKGKKGQNDGEASNDQSGGKGKGKGNDRSLKFLCTFVVGIPDTDPFEIKKRIFGPGGKNMKRIANRFQGCKLRLRGRGSGFVEWDTGAESTEPLQLNLSIPDRESYEAIKHEVGRLLQRQYQEYFKVCKRTVELTILEHPKNPK